MNVILAWQLLAIAAIACIVIAAMICFPNPSPFIRTFLPPRKRWPETQIRSWLQSGRFQPSFLRYFYRDPERTIPVGDGILAPADGLVTSAAVQGGVRYLVVALSFWDMHVQRSPLAGRVVKVEDHGAEFMDGEGREFAFLREKPCPVQKRLVMATAAGTLAVRLITSIAARRIETWVNEGEAVTRGQRIGRILLGSTVVLELPEGLPLAIRVGDRIRAGETIVANAETSA